MNFLPTGAALSVTRYASATLLPTAWKLLVNTSIDQIAVIAGIHYSN
ncbi:hypothetical protein [Chamaesiphon sp. OTE_75_metabat_556]|nr:hypothetical protein [Chamaesiphon sp. OTE_75_metabat_556]